MRDSGILLHISSLPGRYGIGTLGEEAFAFVDFLKSTKQHIWQVLPINPTSYGDSPYQSNSAFAGNPYFIDFDLLAKDGLLAKSDYENVDFGSNNRVDYEKLFHNKIAVLNKAYIKKDIYAKEFNAYKQEEAYWLDDFALYQAVKECFCYRPFNEWQKEYKYRDPSTLQAFINQHGKEIDQIKFLQFLFAKQWKALKNYANSNDVKIIGDMPIYAAYDSVDVWSNPKYFQLDSNLTPTFVAGCPPDFFSEDGQMWGNPLYDYDQMKVDGFDWWVKRIGNALKFFDVVRIDHFRGFAGYYSIPFGEKTARIGSWQVGPGMDLFAKINEIYGNKQIIAENLGFLDDTVWKLLDDCGYPGMSILEFEIGNGYEECNLEKGIAPHNVLYTGTHDNQTIMSWFDIISDVQRAKISKICDITDKSKLNLQIIKFCYNSDVEYVVIPWQDFLGLYDEEGRMNEPSTLGKNWQYRTKKEDFSKEIEDFIKEITISSGRNL